MSAKIKTVPLADIRFDGGTQMRVGLDGDTVREYRDAYESGAEMPPIVVYFDGASHWLADGFHRWHAKHEGGANDIECEVRKGSQRDAIWHAVGANSSHGLRRTNEDKHKAVKTILADAEWSRLSDRQIAEHCGVSHNFVGTIRKQVSSDDTCEAGQSKRRTGADGKSYPAVPKHVKPTTKEPGEPTRSAAASPGKPVEWSCPNCGSDNKQSDDRGVYCGNCLDSDEIETPQPEPPAPKKPEPKSTIIARCEQFWATLTETERIIAAGWFNDQL